MSISSDLRQAVLQAAIQGKLTKQLPEDGNAKNLLEQIKAEKAKLVKEGKLKKEKPLPEITDDEKPFDIPENWEWVRWGNVSFSIQYGYNAAAKAQGRIKMVRISDIQENGVVWETVPYCDIDEKEIETYLLAQDDILFARTGGTIGKSFLVKKVKEEAVYAGYLIRTRYSKLLVPEYLKSFMGSQLYWNQLRVGTIATAQPNCNGQTLSKMMLPLPPLSEQKRIVAKVEELMRKIDDLEKTEKELEALKKVFPADMKAALLQAAMQGKLTEQLPEDGNAKDLLEQIKAEKAKLVKEGKLKKEKPLLEIAEDEKPFDIPENWEWVKLNKVAFVTKLAGFEYTKDIAPNLSSYGIPLFKGKNVQNGHLVYEFEAFIPESISDRLERSQLRKPCLLTPYVGTLGNIAIFDGTFKAHLGSNVGKIELINTNEENIELRYLLYYLLSPFGIYQLSKHSKKTAQESISIEAIRDVIIAMPPYSEQKRIVEKLEKLLPLCDGLK